MKEMLMNFAAKWFGVNKVIDAIDGKKSYLGGGGLVLVGAGMILLDAVPVVASKNATQIVMFVSGLAVHPGTHKVLEGLAVLGLRHAVAKAADAQ